MATRKPKAATKAQTEAPADNNADGAIDVQGTETLTETPVADVASAPEQETPTQEVTQESAQNTQPDAGSEQVEPSTDDPAETVVNPGAPGVIKTVTPIVEGLTEEDMDLSKLTAIINPDRSGYDGVLKQGDRTIANIDCGPDSASAADIKADLMAAGMPETNIQVLRD